MIDKFCRNYIGNDKVILNISHLTIYLQCQSFFLMMMQPSMFSPHLSNLAFSYMTVFDQAYGPVPVVSLAGLTENLSERFAPVVTPV